MFQDLLANICEISRRKSVLRRREVYTEINSTSFKSMIRDFEIEVRQVADE